MPRVGETIPPRVAALFLLDYFDIYLVNTFI